MNSSEATPALDFLDVATPQAWLEAVPDHIPELLIDHANCEKKAASTALSMIYRYVDHSELLFLMSRLAREELLHFEQVMSLMAQQSVPYRQLSASRYAGELHKLVAKQEPQRLTDALILGAVVEARSCERFVQLIDVLPEAYAKLYRRLVTSEARHFADYLELANQISELDLNTRVALFVERDAELVTRPDREFRFHSGVPY